jgi:hypothetical protein
VFGVRAHAGYAKKLEQIIVNAPVIGNEPLLNIGGYSIRRH